MEAMFQECNQLIYLDLSNFNTSKFNDMEGMFNKCYKLKEKKGINNFKTNNVTNMRIMFQECNELISLDLSNFNTYNITNMCYMLHNCNKLEYLNIANFVIKNNCKTDNIFDNIKKECKIIINDDILKGLYYSSY